MSVVEVEFTRAELADLDRLTELVVRSKASNGYSEEFMAAFTPELIVRPELLQVGEIWVCSARGEVAAMLNVVATAQTGELEAMFVDPAFKGQGVGRRVWEFALERFRALGVQIVELDSDPHSTGFYEAMGCEQIGHTESETIPGRLLPRMRKVLANEI